MNFTFLDLARDVVGLAAGGVIGLAFGTLQQAALRQNEQLEQAGKVKSGWSLMPKAGARVSYLLITLVLIQFICPLLFADGTQWIVSAGVVLGYGAMLLSQLRHRLRMAAR